MFTGKQLRAARALAEWTIGDLAEKSGLNLTSLAQIEREDSIPRKETVHKILDALAERGIEFTEHQGVRLKPEGMEVLEGSTGIKHFLDSAYAFAERTGGTIRQNGIEDVTFFAKAKDVTDMHVKRMSLLRTKEPNLVVRVLTSHGVYDQQCPEYAVYKWLPLKSPSAVPFYTFGKTVGLFAVGDRSVPRIYVISSQIIAHSYNAQFDSAWDMAETPVDPRLKRIDQ